MVRRRLSDELILRWADLHRRRTGRWPSVKTGIVSGTRGLTWRRVDNALRYGLRGLPGGSSLALFLADRRQARNRTTLPELSVRRVLAWARAHHKPTGVWPTMDSVAVADQPGETWSAVNAALREGCRGLPGGDSPGRLLARRTAARTHCNLARLTVDRILAWCDAYHERTGSWPRHRTGDMADVSGETWNAINSALRNGYRGLPGGTSLYRLLKERRGIPGPRPSLRRSREKVGACGRPYIRLNLPAEVAASYRAGELTIGRLAERCGISFNTARRELIRIGLLTPVPGRSSRIRGRLMPAEENARHSAGS